jgi:hypothetical protein
MSQLLWLLVGIGLSCISIASQWLVIRKLEPQSKTKVAWFFSLGFVLRLALAGVLLILAIKQGFLSAIIMFVGMLVSRYGILFWINSRSNAVKSGGAL